MMLKKITVSMLLLFLGFSSPTIHAKEINDSVALNGIETAKSVFLIDFTNPKKTAFYLDIILGTHKGLTKQNVKSNMVLVFIGQTVQYLSTEPADDLALESEDELNSIQASIKEFSKLGVRMEVCAVATRVFGVDNDTIPKEMNMVADGFVSLIGWQTQGHKLVPIF
ncbi:DsrE family protein [Candidatus Thioglobus sp.]|uniref:DsrE family protein n=1 Tax=Candidatus Thioglobus sp. TaxID=2026721 RepID=UPI001D223065|nr:DsrE family protein [Candidatus Thioglobus sp.]MBT3276692.1 DsrE family protein [Candidatus Thioglobus sp.]MBT3447555.1 DsrE family protein [Candidatus Thioglobus sp.]MBT3745226.1 DsrE family protein [Candidatus Thioglobus sp.]MBT4001387.1 DsrE family protein [Candidatus Thioglobus sp.]MBT4182066.1 DsrE family protein [Candidatus Thioglobus sp.]